jgi:hypothetical protein
VDLRDLIATKAAVDAVELAFKRLGRQQLQSGGDGITPKPAFRMVST